MSLLPREHGAYGQLSLPLVTALLTGGATVSSLLLAGAAVMAFLAHEPLLVLLGGRGVRARRDQAREAATWLATTTMVGLSAALVAVMAMPSAIRWSLWLPATPAIVLAIAVARGREKSLAGELAAAATFSMVAVPVSLSGAAPAAAAVSVGAVFASIFVSGTLAVRGVVLTVRGGGDPAAARRTRLGTMLFSFITVAGGLALALQALAPWAALAAAMPGLASAAWIAAFPPPPAKLRTVGWTLVAASSAAALILIGSQVVARS